MSSKFKRLWKPDLFKLMVMILIVFFVNTLIVYAEKRTQSTGSFASEGATKSQSAITDSDPMEPCYLSNNRASESLTISESTPVGTVVGEIMVNGDSSANGNIELSIKMPSSNVQTNAGLDSGSNRHHQAAFNGQRQSRQTNGFSSTSATLLAKNSQTTSLKSLPSTGSGFGVSDQSKLKVGAETQTSGIQIGSKMVRDLNNLIDLMPPLSIEHDTKRLVLAKKLDRENLDRYILANGYQTSPISSLSQSSSASLTVHIKCQLRDKTKKETENSSTNQSQSQPLNNTTKKISQTQTTRYSNSILIPVHLIVTDENDNWPLFINAPYIVDLNETVSIGTPLPGNEIVAVDNDQQGPLSTIEYSIVGGSFWSDSFGFLNPLDSRSLIVKDNRLLDYESQSKITLKVMARDQGEPPNWAISSLYINLFDIDDMNPVFSEDKYLGYIRENRPGEVVDVMPKRLSARDGDKTINAPIVYSFHLKTNHSIHFDLDPEVGRLSLKKTLPEEAGNQPFCLLIRATQADNPQRWSLTMVQMRLSQVPLAHGVGQPISQLEQLLAIGSSSSNTNDRQPAQQAGSANYQSQTSAGFRFAQPNFTVQVSEAAPAGYTLLNLKAATYNLHHHHHHQREGSLSNSKAQESVTYHLLDDEFNYFNLEPQTGRLSLNRSLDYELHRQLTIRILATTEENNQRQTSAATTTVQYPRLTCDLVSVIVNILPHNDFTPEFSHEQYNFQLSVSDLIANFELPKVQIGGSTIESQDFDDDSKTATNDLRRKLTKRFGDHQLDLNQFNGDESLDEPLAWPAMQLGQVYCADRDYGDRLSLQLIGSKASVFHLTQDGRLYLPLVNTSSSTNQLFGNRQQANDHASSVVSKQSELPAWSSKRSLGTINNQFVQSRFFAQRRNDHQPSRGQEFPDRNYLNYLLGEFSNLGRLRLKVLATDNGQPEQRQATALIVITVISIDNFILQRAPQLPTTSGQQNSAAATGDHHSDNNAIQLSNTTSYDTSRSPDSDGRENNRSQSYTNQVMMIPATNGRSFVQINPDIISNLISQNAFYTNTTPTINYSNTNDTSKRGTNNENSSTLLLRTTTGSGVGRHLGGNNSVEIQSESESTIQSQTTNTRFQPPSLLLVDDDGAKFVAMPAAIEVYNQQVQEAAEQQQQQARQRSQSASSSDGAKQAHESSLWYQWKSQFGLGFNSKDSINQQAGSLYWLNLSTAIMLHLIALVVVVTLVSRIRWPLNGGVGGGSRGLWPSSTQISRLSWRRGREHSVASILDQQASGTYGSSNQANLTSSSENSSENSSFGFPHSNPSHSPLQHQTQQQRLSNQQQQSSPTMSDNSSSKFPIRSNRQQQQSVSSGVIVSAISNGYKLKCQPKCENIITADGDLDSKQQNLFGHLKLTLNKMLDSSCSDEGKQKDCCVGQVSIRPLDSDSIKFEPSLLGQEQELVIEQQTSSRMNEPTTTRSSTFVGQSNANGSVNQQEVNCSSGGSKQKQVVSISVTSPNLEVSPSSSSTKVENLRSNQRLATAGSSSSSVVSLISMSSSISNKINAAVQRTGENTATGSDVSSLDSSTLFNNSSPNKCSSISSPVTIINPKASASGAAAVAPPPPPPPPPPCLVQVGGRLVIESLRQAAAKQAATENMSTDRSSEYSSMKSPNGTKPFSARPLDSVLDPSTRRPLPQNPLHLKLRQQASGQQSQDQQSRDRNNRQQQQTTCINGNRKQSLRIVNGSSRASMSTNSVHQTTSTSKLRPPTPPPLPGQPLALNTKTVSPTTSVDRGYESLQSYTSSSQQQKLANSTRNPPINRGGSKGVSGKPRGTLTSDNVARVRRASQTLAFGAITAVSGPTMSTAHRISQHQQNSRTTTQLSTSNDISGAESVSMIQSQSRRPVAGRGSVFGGQATSSRVHEEKFSSDKLDYETEDDDFYYCYNQLAATLENNALNNATSNGNATTLSDYVSHAYLKAETADGCEFTNGGNQSQLLHQFESGGSETQYNKPLNHNHNHHHHHHNHHHHRHHSGSSSSKSTSSRIQQQQQQLQSSSNSRHQHNLYSAAAAAKKQLTWSDQVRLN